VFYAASLCCFCVVAACWIPVQIGEMSENLHKLWKCQGTVYFVTNDHLELYSKELHSSRIFSIVHRAAVNMASDGLIGCSWWLTRWNEMTIDGEVKLIESTPCNEFVMALCRVRPWLVRLVRRNVPKIYQHTRTTTSWTTVVWSASEIRDQ